jgi:hypothetical protein
MAPFSPGAFPTAPGIVPYVPLDNTATTRKQGDEEHGNGLRRVGREPSRAATEFASLLGKLKDGSEFGLDHSHLNSNSSPDAGGRRGMGVIWTAAWICIYRHRKSYRVVSNLIRGRC